LIPKECKRLAEVDFPIAVVSKQSLRETYLRQGHPKSLHLWWARRPLSACRTILLALLFPDPCDPHCPEDFKEKARDLLPKVQGKVGANDKDLQQALLKFIGDFSNWDLSTNQTYLEVGRGLVKAAHLEETPLVVDPFAGGGSIPLEALRLGCETFASDLNPVAYLLLKVVLEDIPRQGMRLAEELRHVGTEVKDLAKKVLAKYCPPDPDGAQPLIYLWARSIHCDSPKCGAEIPLVRSFWLCRKRNRRYALKYRVVHPNDTFRTTFIKRRKELPYVELEVFEPKSDLEVPSGTIQNGRATCPVCNSVIPGSRLQAQLKEKYGGANNGIILAVVTRRDQSPTRAYRVATQRDYEIFEDARDDLQKLINTPTFPTDLTENLSPIRPSPNARGVSAPTRYGATRFKDLFLARQQLSLMTLSKIITGTTGSQSIHRLLTIALNKVAMKCNAHCRWIPTGESLADLFGRHAIAVVWDFAESIPIIESAGSWDKIIDQMQEVLTGVSGAISIAGQVSIGDACQSPLPDQAADIWFTDPPYYDNIPYADISDFFYVWMKRSLIGDSFLGFGEYGNSQLTPKEKEIVWNQAHIVNGKPKTPEFFELSIAKACHEGRRILSDIGIGCMVFAHKTTEGWEALLNGMVKSGWLITASWPVATEMPTRVSARDSASLATSIHLICRPRPNDAPVGDWGDVLRELPKRVGDWMERLQSEGVRGADLVFACIGPALEIYSRYSKVVDAEEREIPLGGDPEATEPHRKGFLAYVWEVVGRTALEQVLGTPEALARNSTAGALEEDARLTALFLWTLQSTNGNGAREKEKNDEDIGEDEEEESPKKKKQGYSLIFDVVRRFAQPLGIHLTEWEGRIIETEKGIVRLLSVKDRAKQLFGEENAQAFADRFERSPEVSLQLKLFPEGERGSAPEIKGHRGRKKKAMGAVSDEALRAKQEATTLDRIHAAMLLQANGRTNALRALLKAEQDRGSDFLRLANALSALYPKVSEEKRLLDAMLLAMPRT